MAETSRLNPSDINSVQIAGSREAALAFLEARLAPEHVPKRFAEAMRTGGTFKGNDREESYFRYLTELKALIDSTYPPA